MKMLPIALLGCLSLVACSSTERPAPTPGPSSAPPAQPGPPPLRMPAGIPEGEWIPVELPVACRTARVTIPKGRYVARPIVDVTTNTLSKLAVNRRPAEEVEFEIDVVGFTTVTEMYVASSAELRGGGGSATLWLRLKGTNGEFASEPLEVPAGWETGKGSK